MSNLGRASQNAHGRNSGKGKAKAGSSVTWKKTKKSTAVGKKKRLMPPKPVESC